MIVTPATKGFFLHEFIGYLLLGGVLGGVYARPGRSSGDMQRLRLGAPTPAGLLDSPGRLPLPWVPVTNSSASSTIIAWHEKKREKMLFAWKSNLCSASFWKPEIQNYLLVQFEGVTKSVQTLRLIGVCLSQRGRAMLQEVLIVAHLSYRHTVKLI